jgi:hypothetical protein
VPYAKIKRELFMRNSKKKQIYVRRGKPSSQVINVFLSCYTIARDAMVEPRKYLVDRRCFSLFTRSVEPGLYSDFELRTPSRQKKIPYV